MRRATLDTPVMMSLDDLGDDVGGIDGVDGTGAEGMAGAEAGSEGFGNDDPSLEANAASLFYRTEALVTVWRPSDDLADCLKEGAAFWVTDLAPNPKARALAGAPSLSLRATNMTRRVRLRAECLLAKCAPPPRSIRDSCVLPESCRP